jgi:hypothetical protein
LQFAGIVQPYGRFALRWLPPGLGLSLRGQSGSLSLFRSLDESSGPSLPPVLPKFIGTLATSDSLPGFVTALSGFALIRFPTGRIFFRRTELGLSG